MKKFLLYLSLAAFLMLFTVSYGYAADYSVIDLNTAREMALNNSREMILVELDVEKSEIQVKIKEDMYYGSKMNSLYKYRLDQLVKLERELSRLITEGAALPTIEAKRQEIATLEGTISVMKGMMSSGQTEKAKDDLIDAEYAYEDEQRKMEDANEKLAYKVEGKYSNILQQEAMLEYLEKNLNLLQKKLEIERIKKELGMSIDTEVQKLVVDVSAIRDSINKMRVLVENLKWEFNDLLGREHEAPLNLIDYSIPLTVEIPTADDIYVCLLENNISINSLKRAIELNEDRLDKDYIDSNKEQKDLFDIAIKESKITLEEQKTLFKTIAANLVSNLRSKYEAYQNASITFSNAKKNFQWDQTKYELGLIAKLQFDLSETVYLDARNKLYTAGHELYLAKRAVEMSQKGILVQTSP